MTDRNIHTLAGAYALDALDDHERLEFESHLAGCPECRDEVGELREAATTLAAATEHEPPESLRASVMRRIQSVRPLPPEIPTDIASHDENDDESALTGPESRRSAKARLKKRTKILAAVAAALVIITGAGSAIWQPWNTGTHSSPSAKTSTAHKVLQAPDAQRVSVDVPDNGTVTLVQSRSVGRAVVKAPDMKSAPKGKDFQLWLKRPGSDMKPAGLMPKTAGGPVLVDGNTTEAAAVGITLEPQGGSAEPTSDPLALFDLSDTSS